MKMDQPKDRLLRMLKENNYMCLGTSLSDAPWLAPLYFAYDEEYRLFFVSPVHTRHHDDIQKNEQVSVAIYDSNSEIGQGDGIQLEGKASILDGEEAKYAAEVLFSRRFSDSKQRAKYLDIERYTDDSPLRLFRVDPINWFVADFSSKFDSRVEVVMSPK